MQLAKNTEPAIGNANAAGHGCAWWLLGRGWNDRKEKNGEKARASHSRDPHLGGGAMEVGSLHSPADSPGKPSPETGHARGEDSCRERNCKTGKREPVHVGPPGLSRTDGLRDGHCPSRHHLTGLQWRVIRLFGQNRQ